MAKKFIFIGLISWGFFVFGQEDKISLYRGNQSFENQDFGEASSHYQKAIEKNKQNAKAHYNLGNTFYKQGNYKEAITSYEKTLQLIENQEERKAILYNLGNAYYQNGNREKAIEHYKKALKYDPYDERVLRNLRIAKKEQDSHKQSDKEQQNNKKESDEKQRENQQNEQKQNTNNQQTKRSKEEENLLKYLEEKEKQTAKRALQQQGYTQPQSNRKDW